MRARLQRAARHLLGRESQRPPRLLAAKPEEVGGHQRRLPHDAGAGAEALFVLGLVVVYFVVVDGLNK